MKIKTAILGYGRSGSTLHADPIEKIPDFEMTAVCDIDPAARAKAAGRFRCKTYADYRAMIARENLDLVVIVTRSDQHCAMACDCLKAGRNVLVTKPWAVNAAEARRMIGAARKSGRLLLPWLPARWGADLLRLKEIVASGAIGKVFQVRRSEFSFSRRNDWQTLRRYGGGYLLNWGPHLIDQPLQLVGRSVETVYGQIRQIINPGDVEDVFFAVMKTVDGVLVVAEHNIGAKGLPNWVIQGDRGTIFVRETEIEIHTAKFPPATDPQSYGTQPSIAVSRDLVRGKNMITMGNRYGDPFVIYPHIARAVRGLEPYAVTPESALELSTVLDAVRDSARTGKAVRPAGRGRARQSQAK